MRHEYIITFEVWQDGSMVSKGNQTLSLESNGPPPASEFKDFVKKDAAARSECAPDEILLTGVFKL